MSWIAPTPRSFATRMPVARRRDPLVLRDGDVPFAEAPGRLLAQDARSARRPRRARRRRPCTSRSPPARASAARVEPERVVVLRPQRGGALAGDRVERLARGVLRPARRRASRGRGSTRRRGRWAATRASASASDAGTLELDVAASQRPGREVDVRVGERRAGRSGRAGRRGRASGARSRASRRRRRSARPAIASAARRRQRGIHRADDAVREDHARSLDTRPRERNRAVPCGTLRSMLRPEDR